MPTADGRTVRRDHGARARRARPLPDRRRGSRWCPTWRWRCVRRSAAPRREPPPGLRPECGSSRSGTTSARTRAGRVRPPGL